MRKIYTNGNFYTFDQVKPAVEAVVVENGRFIDMGTTEDMVLNWQRPEVKTIDLHGKTVTPGLIDSHLHLSAVGQNFLNLDLTGVASKQEMLQKIQRKAITLKAGEWLQGRGWDENLFIDGGIPTIEELDKACPSHPLFLSRVCGHAALVNSKALEVCHYHPSMTIPEGGTIVIDEQTKKPTGLLLESAADLITQHIPERTYDELKNTLRQAIQFAITKGLTSVHTNDPLFLGGLNQTYKLYNELLNKEQLGLRCNLLINHEFLKDLRENGMYAGYGNETLQIGAIKIFADGALGRRTALLSEPYSDAPDEYGKAMFDQDTLYEIVKNARSLSMPTAVHTIGDQALENVLDVLDQFPPVAYRDRIIHVQVAHNELIKRLATPSRIADIQPRFVVGDFPWVEDRLGEERIKLAYAWKTLIESGVICAGGSDAPVEPVDPLLGIHAAVTRKVPGQTHNGWNAKEKLTMTEAFHLFTKMGAYPTNEETVKGTISRGKLADMTVYSANPFKMEDPDALLNTDIEMTIINGDVKYEKSLVPQDQ
ncbi:amidohydrolase family protein [Virgibacillus dakarensis]|uniref:Amidohydrolase YtcJ n=1 Tax=Lentibacillus populi TaxID=1827502 RepID=A0A9W5TZC5_9BACI|nr:amidohydrolase [Lentibacillus populi]MBT2215589.1 amidohydrolase [Virgibacillus dakarensis]MTW85216.1 amidohydrolase family protein [Virgibacillus dakarensis]GGB48648.1 putative amidohydrolase YtcJ [Lentibacillus populi]